MINKANNQKGEHDKRRMYDMESILFGIIDNGVLILGAYTGLNIEKHLPPYLQNGAGAVVGAGIGNAVSDFLAGLPMGLGFALGVFLGCLIPMVFVGIKIALKANSGEKKGICGVFYGG